MLKKLPVQLILVVFLAFFICDFLSFSHIRFFFTISCFIKEILMAVLPIVIFSYISAAIIGLESRAPVLIFTILLFVAASNALSVIVSYFVGLGVLPLITVTSQGALTSLSDQVQALYCLDLPQLMSPDRAMLAGLTVGLLFSFVKIQGIAAVLFKGRDFVNMFLKKAFIPVLPLYVFGFVLKMRYEGSFGALAENFGQVFLLVCFLIITYIGVLYFIAAGFNPKKAWQFIQTMLPAGVTGFSTMSSAATMPVTLAAVETNSENPEFTQLVIPTTVNIHLMGDSLGIPLIGMAVLLLSGYPLPLFETYMGFVVYFCLAKFSTAGIPGGGVIVLLPVLQSHLGLTPEMASLVATLYILQDPIFTSSNVMGNGAFALLLQKICGFFVSPKEISRA